MSSTPKVAEPETIAKLTLTVTRGVTAGLAGSIPQVLVAQLVAQALGVRERADIGPRFIRRAAQHAGSSPSGPLQWLLAAVFHFEYAAGWGTLYALTVERLGARRVPPPAGGAALAALVYAAAFSPIGAATQTGAERPPERRWGAERLVHWSSALGFALTAAFAYRWLGDRW